MENQKLTTLQQKHPVFTYHSADVEYRENTVFVNFKYSFNPDLVFETQLRFHDVASNSYERLDREVLQHWAFEIGMVEALSYWKAACSPEFVIEAGYLNQEQLGFWQNLIHKGLSEFFFVNQIDGWQKGFVRFEVKPQQRSYPVDQLNHSQKVIVPMGGGKDSLVSLELLARAGISLSTLTIQPTDQISTLITIAQQQHNQTFSNILIERHLDSNILELNKDGYLNGHTPFSAMAAFVTTFAAYLFDFAYVAVSNEFSANEGNTVFLGQTINHQYSKTVEFEEAFREYCQKYLSKNIEYFSFLRPLHEIQIARLFAQYPEYFSAFLSCNRGHKTGHWCGECAKCLFVYTMLSPFLSRDQLTSIWGSDLFAKEGLQSILDELTGVTEVKSFDCVGTRDEMLVALSLTIKNMNQRSESLPVLLQYAQEKILKNSNELQAKTEELLLRFEEHHFIPRFLLIILTDAFKKVGLQ
jgi:UDP-N-acetyl-alpha-D-muramoyl-L-alanyl-L-glutamate epimerase